MTYTVDQLQPGMTASLAKTLTEADIVLTRESPPTNPAHLDENTPREPRSEAASPTAC